MKWDGVNYGRDGKRYYSGHPLMSVAFFASRQPLKASEQELGASEERSVMTKWESLKREELS